MIIHNPGQRFFIKDTHRGLYYEDGKLTKILEAGRYRIPVRGLLSFNAPTVECLLVDVRKRELTIKGQEVAHLNWRLTSSEASSAGALRV